MYKAVILMGLPGSGKSTYADNLPLSYKIFSRDFIRYEKGYADLKAHVRLSVELEDEVTEEFNRKMKRKIKTEMGRGNNLVFDTVGSKAEYRMKYISELKEHGYRVEVVRISRDLDQCVEARRGSACTRDVIEGIASSFEDITDDELKLIDSYKIITIVK